jgi:hypothetical protein
MRTLVPPPVIRQATGDGGPVKATQ